MKFIVYNAELSVCHDFVLWQTLDPFKCLITKLQIENNLFEKKLYYTLLRNF